MILGALMYKKTFICEFRFLSDTFLDYFLINFLQIQVVNSFFFPQFWFFSKRDLLLIFFLATITDSIHIKVFCYSKEVQIFEWKLVTVQTPFSSHRLRLHCRS